MGRKDDEIDVGKRIAGWRKRKGISQIEVARRADLAPSYLSRIEKGRIHPTFRMASRIASALGMSLDDLLGHSPPRRKGRPCPVSVSGACLIDLV